MAKNNTNTTILRTQINKLLNQMTQKELSEKIGISQRYISEISRGGYVPPKIRKMEPEIIKRLEEI